MSRSFLRANSAHVNVGSAELSAAHTVTQIVEVVQKAGGHRERRLIELLKQYRPSKDNLILVFALYKREVDYNLCH
jgi:ATP-dependent RNA helicase DBP3